LSLELHDLIARAHRTRRTRARIIIEECLERLPHYHGLPKSLLREIHDSTLHHLALLYRVTLQTGRPLNDEDLVYSRELARKRASQGVPLGEFLTFFQVGLARAWEHLIRSAGDDPDLREQLLDRVEAVISNQTQLMSALTEAHVEQRERLSRFREQDLDEFVELLLAEDAVPSVIEARAKALGIALEESRAIAIFGPSRSDLGAEGVGTHELRERLAARLLSADVWVGRAREGFVALVPEPADPKALAAVREGLFADGGCVGFGGAGRDPEGLRRSAREALRALQIGECMDGARRVHGYDDVAVLDLLRIDTADAEAFMQRVLGTLATTRASRTYLETLRQLSAHNYRIKLAAAELSIHPHTLSYRIQQLRRRFGIDLEDPQVRLHTQLALLIRDARGPSLPADA